jgi:iron complex transport system permease protein
VLWLRLPRVGAAVAAGMLLAVAGVLLQRLTGNPMASPEVTGISSGAGLGALCAALVLPGLDRGDLLAGAGAGAAAAAAALLLAGRRSGFGSERLLLSGVALAAIGGAFSALVLAGNHPRLDLVLRLMAGSTYLATAGEAAGSLFAAAAALAFLAMAARPVAVMGLGASNAQALGVPVPPTRLMILLAASAATAAATLVVGPLSFAGLLAPHMARLLGLTRPLAQGIGGALIGGALMAAADLAGRMLAFPWQIPAGLLCTLLGAPYFLWLMARRS